jgi:hypothetical protein
MKQRARRAARCRAQPPPLPCPRAPGRVSRPSAHLVAVERRVGGAKLVQPASSEGVHGRQVGQHLLHRARGEAADHDGSRLGVKGRRRLGRGAGRVGAAAAAPAGEGAAGRSRGGGAGARAGPRRRGAPRRPRACAFARVRQPYNAAADRTRAARPAAAAPLPPPPPPPPRPRPRRRAPPTPRPAPVARLRGCRHAPLPPRRGRGPRQGCGGSAVMGSGGPDHHRRPRAMPQAHHRGTRWCAGSLYMGRTRAAGWLGLFGSVLAR